MLTTTCRRNRKDFGFHETSKMRAPRLRCLTFTLAIAAFCCRCKAKTNEKSAVLDNVGDVKEFKKILRTRTNVLVMLVSSAKDAQVEQKIFQEAAIAVRGIGTMVLVDCSASYHKKLCKKLKVGAEPYTLKHYNDGDFHKDYDRQMSVVSMVNFMRDPKGDLPWEEDPSGGDVMHFDHFTSFTKLLKRDPPPLLMMFYVQWCQHCKRLKPEYSKAATELKTKGYVLAAMDVERPANAAATKVYNVTGFPRILYFEKGKPKYTYEGEYNRDALIAFMYEPSAAQPNKSKEMDWSADPNSEIVHLTTQGFDPATRDEGSVLVMFYAPWCAHCKRMKPDYEKAAVLMRMQQVPGVLAALDATKEKSIAERFDVRGYPTLKYFVNGKFQFDVNVRIADDIVEFMRHPKEPPPPPPADKRWEEEDKETEIQFLNDDNFNTTLKQKKHVLVMFFAPWCGHCKNAKPEFEAAARTLKEDPRIMFAAVDCTRYANLCNAYEVRGYPTIKYFSHLKTKSDYNGGRKHIDFVKFISTTSTDKKATEVKPFGKYPGAESIIMLTARTYPSMIEKHKYLLVYIYVPWCSYCTKIKPKFAASSKLAKERGDIVFAAIDAYAYPELMQEYLIQSFPTLLFFKNGAPSKTYTGSITVDKILTQLQNNPRHDEL